MERTKDELLEVIVGRYVSSGGFTEPDRWLAEPYRRRLAQGAGRLELPSTKRPRCKHSIARRRCCPAPARQTYTYVRNGTSDLYAALDVASGKVITQMTDQHRAVEFRAFLNLTDKVSPDDLAVHVICDNASAHKAPPIQRWLKRHRRFTLHYTPTYSSWLNQVERWFSELTTKKLRRATHRSVDELRQDINNWVEHWNENPRPFVWRKTADQILDTLVSYLTRINDSRN